MNGNPIVIQNPANRKNLTVTSLLPEALASFKAVLKKKKDSLEDL